MSDFKKLLEGIYEESEQANAEKAAKEAAARKQREENKAAAERLFDERVIPWVDVFSREAHAKGLRVDVQRSGSGHSQGWMSVEVRNASTYKTSSWRMTAAELQRFVSTEFKMNVSGVYDKSPVSFDEITDEWVQERLGRLYKDILNTKR